MAPGPKPSGHKQQLSFLPVASGRSPTPHYALRARGITHSKHRGMEGEPQIGPEYRLVTRSRKAQRFQKLTTPHPFVRKVMSNVSKLGFLRSLPLFFLPTENRGVSVLSLVVTIRILCQGIPRDIRDAKSGASPGGPLSTGHKSEGLRLRRPRV
jgi:hypothetical protein